MLSQGALQDNSAHDTIISLEWSGDLQGMHCFRTALFFTVMENLLVNGQMLATQGGEGILSEIDAQNRNSVP
jgi:hypothetical protein